MHLADFHERSTAAVAHLLGGIDQWAFAKRARKTAISIAFDQSAVDTFEGRTSLLLVNDLAARFYPGILYDDRSGNNETCLMVAELGAAARAIHPRIEFTPADKFTKATIVVGSTDTGGRGRSVYVGSDGWRAIVASSGPVGSGRSGNPCGAAAAACIGMANLFRATFLDLVPDQRLDQHVEIDVLNHRRWTDTTAAAPLNDIDLGETHLVGLGAIGRATAWTLARVARLRGELVLVDHETIEHSNLQRYVFSTQRDGRRSRSKVEAAASMFTQPTLAVVPQPWRWAEYLARRGNCNLDRVATALDTGADRISVQAVLPRRALNAWTQPGDLGTSRHDFLEGACLACLYLPEHEAPSLSQAVADATGLPELEVRAVLQVGGLITADHIDRICTAKGIERTKLDRLANIPLASFYQRAVCGSALLPPSGAERGEMAVPMAFQSALAGVLLAVDILADAGRLRSAAINPKTVVNLLKPIGKTLTEPLAKSRTGRCICQDPIYREAYARKYSPIGAVT